MFSIKQAGPYKRLAKDGKSFLIRLNDQEIPIDTKNGINRYYCQFDTFSDQVKEILNKINHFLVSEDYDSFKWEGNYGQSVTLTLFDPNKIKWVNRDEERHSICAEGDDSTLPTKGYKADYIITIQLPTAGSKYNQPTLKITKIILYEKEEVVEEEPEIIS